MGNNQSALQEIATAVASMQSGGLISNADSTKVPEVLRKIDEIVKTRKEQVTELLKTQESHPEALYIKSKNDMKMTALDLACHFRCVPVVEKLLQLGFRPIKPMTGIDHDSLFWLFSIGMSTPNYVTVKAIISLMIKYCPKDLENRCNDTDVLLDICEVKNYDSDRDDQAILRDILVELVVNGADPLHERFLADDKSITPLHAAAKSGNRYIIAELISMAGTKPGEFSKVVNFKASSFHAGGKAIDVAKRENHKECVELLRNAPFYVSPEQFMKENFQTEHFN
jgi:ankyrin repeat protein